MSEQLDILSYDKYIIYFSGGKDCTAAFLHLIEQGVLVSKIELWHHLVDGAQHEPSFMDWPVTYDYCKKFAAHFNVPIYFSWKEGGFKREMLRDNTATAETCFEIPDEEYREGPADLAANPRFIRRAGGNSGRLGVRRRFPQVTASLRQRWCSAYLKIDVAQIAIRNQNRFDKCRVLTISGERAEESPGRAKYKIFEEEKVSAPNFPHYRIVHRHRPVLHYTRKQVWEIIKRHKVIVHPAYYRGFGRVSCAFCIFASREQLAAVADILPEMYHDIVTYENEFGVSIKRKEFLPEYIAKAALMQYYPSYPQLDIVLSGNVYELPIVNDKGRWVLPKGAYGQSSGPV